MIVYDDLQPHEKIRIYDVRARNAETCVMRLRCKLAAELLPNISQPASIAADHLP